MTALDFQHHYQMSLGDDRTLVLLHGTGGNEHSLSEIGNLLAPKAHKLGVRGKVLENGSVTRYFRRLQEGVFDMEDLVFRTDELADFLRAASVEYGFDLSKAVAVGYSNGANMAVSLLLRHPDTLGGAVLLRPQLPYDPENVPNLTGKRILMLSGTHDPLMTRDQVDSLAALLRTAGADVTFHWQAADHGLRESDMNIAGGWLDTF